MNCPRCPHPRSEHASWGCMWFDCPVTYDDLMREGTAQGERLRDKGMARVVTDPRAEDWRAELYAWIVRLPSGRRFTSTEAVDALGMPPTSPNSVGACIAGAAKTGLIRSTDTYIKSARPSRHAAIVKVWERA